MKNNKILIAAMIAMGAVAGCADDMGSPAAMGGAGDLSSFEGARAGQAEMGLENMGYELVRTEGLTAYWANSAAGTCAQIVTSDGRYQSVTMVSPSSC